MVHMISWYGPKDMVHMIWSTWYGPHDMLQMIWWDGSYDMVNWITVGIFDYRKYLLWEQNMDSDLYLIEDIPSRVFSTHLHFHTFPVFCRNLFYFKYWILCWPKLDPCIKFILDCHCFKRIILSHKFRICIMQMV